MFSDFVKDKIVKNYHRFLNIPSGDLRISITDMCNMKCIYCHNEGQKHNKKFLDKESIFYIVNHSLQHGVKNVRLTGGEPLLHNDLYEICAGIRQISNSIILGINTNGVIREKLIYLAENNLVDIIAIGLDYADSKISKKSSIGKPSTEILNTILLLKKYKNISLKVDKVYCNDDLNTLKLCDWCIKNDVLIQVIEETGKNIDKSYFENFIKFCIDNYDFDLGVDTTFDELYLYDKATGNKKIKFYQSHCNRNECSICEKIHLRVNSKGFTKPCMFRDDTEINLLDGNFEEAFNKSLSYLGKPSKKDQD